MIRSLASNLVKISSLIALGAFSACLPPGESGQCLEDADCVGRGQVCNIEANLCEDSFFDATSTENPAPGTFSDKVIPFFRGQVCTVTEVQSGSQIPVQLTPCLHPCLTVKTFKFKHFFECTGSSCEAWALAWFTVDGAACPANAFSQFDAGQCAWGPDLDFSMNTTLDSGPIRGTMIFEIPFLTNSDMAALAAMNNNPSTEAIKERIFQYPQDPSRMVNGGNPISLLDQHPVPPADCTGDGCECFQVGF